MMYNYFDEHGFYTHVLRVVYAGVAKIHALEKEYRHLEQLAETLEHHESK